LEALLGNRIDPVAQSVAEDQKSGARAVKREAEEEWN
jgi:hypothetical protein